MSVPPFTVLHVCVGNICRSPMAERLFALALRNRAGEQAATHYLSHGGGTGTWHVGQSMNPPAARELLTRGGDTGGFRARRVDGAMVDGSDLVLCATATQVTYVLDLRADAVAKTFVLGEFGRLLADLDGTSLPAIDGSAGSAYERGAALVAAVDALRISNGQGADRHPTLPADDLDDPWGLADQEFARVADEIEQTVIPLAAVLTHRR